MPSQQIVTLYRTIRNQPEVWAQLNETTDTADLIAQVSIIAAKSGIDLSPDEIRSALPDLPAIIAEASGDCDLTDEELELVSAGSYHGASGGGNKPSFG